MVVPLTHHSRTHRARTGRSTNSTPASRKATNAAFSTCASLTRGAGAVAAAKSIAADPRALPAVPHSLGGYLPGQRCAHPAERVLMRAVVPRRCIMLRRALPHLFTAARMPVRCAPVASLASPGGGLASRLGSLPAGTVVRVLLRSPWPHVAPAVDCSRRGLNPTASSSLPPPTTTTAMMLWLTAAWRRQWTHRSPPRHHR